MPHGHARHALRPDRRQLGNLDPQRGAAARRAHALGAARCARTQRLAGHRHPGLPCTRGCPSGRGAAALGRLRGGAAVAQCRAAGHPSTAGGTGGRPVDPRRPGTVPGRGSERDLVRRRLPVGRAVRRRPPAARRRQDRAAATAGTGALRPAAGPRRRSPRGGRTRAATGVPARPGAPAADQWLPGVDRPVPARGHAAGRRGGAGVADLLRLP